MKTNLVIGILAHVDAGKTTLSEALLYHCGITRKIGRVDHGDAFLDTYNLEKSRGITIFSKQARFETNRFSMTLMDTPGHTDFSSEMERTLGILDAAILVISAPDGVTGHTKTLKHLLEHYKIPTIIFVNKMDQPGMDSSIILKNLQHEFGLGAINFNRSIENPDFQEELASLDETLIEKFIDGIKLTTDDIQKLILNRKLFPVCFGSALKQSGINEFIETIDKYIPSPSFQKSFGASIFKITRESGKKFAWLKITGGSLAVKSSIKIGDSIDKIDEIRVYSGAKYNSVQQVSAGMTCAVAGLKHAKIGMGLGENTKNSLSLLQPIFRSSVILDDNTDSIVVYHDLQTLEEEDPTLKIIYNETSKVISIELMGEVQAEILKNLVSERFSYNISFGAPEIVYKETIENKVEGVGHFEPLKHYAEVHLMLEPAAQGSGIIIENNCPNDMLSNNFQKLILTHLNEKKFVGVLTGSEITDIKITLIAGKAHEKHTEGGDFREATYRAVRQGLMMANSILLEPIMKFSLTIPEINVGHAMNDLSLFGSSFSAPSINNGIATITGTVPAAEIAGYQKTLLSYSGGKGTLYTELAGYEPCHKAEEIISNSKYIADLDLENTSSSVFCFHGAGTIIPWNEVRNYMHIDTGWKPDNESSEELDGYTVDQTFHARTIDSNLDNRTFKEKERDRIAADKELKEIFERTYGPIKSRVTQSDTRSSHRRHDDNYVYKPRNKNTSENTSYLLVDGYNMIFAWDELRQLSSIDIKAARDRLLEILSNYAGYVDDNLIVVFDAYKVAGGKQQIYRYNNLDVIFTKEAETADLYIEQAAHQLKKKYDVTVATSDAIEQVIIFSAGAQRLSAQNFYDRVRAIEKEIDDIIN